MARWRTSGCSARRPWWQAAPTSTASGPAPSTWPASTAVGASADGSAVAIEGDGLANEVAQRRFVDVVVLGDVDRPPRVAVKAGVEQPRRVAQRGALEEGQLDHLLVGLTRADATVARPHRHAVRVRRLRPLALLDHVRVG